VRGGGVCGGSMRGGSGVAYFMFFLKKYMFFV
jgi:hypothetical protein